MSDMQIVHLYMQLGSLRAVAARSGLGHVAVLNRLRRVSERLNVTIVHPPGRPFTTAKQGDCEYLNVKK